MAKCEIPDTNPLNKVCDEIVPTVTPDNPSCKESDGGFCPVVENCTPFDLSKFPDSCLIDNYIEEQLNMGGAIVNLHKLLGVHEQGKLLDLTGNGSAISSGDIPNYPASNAFDKFITEWRSLQVGTAVTSSAYIGYDFGEIKLKNGRNRYGLETFVRHDVASIKIKQSCNENNRASKIRIERSDDGKKWYGVSVLNLQNCDGLLTLNFNRSVPSRYWRIRPVKFNGGSNDWWSIQALQLIDYEVTNLKNIQDRVFLENRDRDYDDIPIEIKGSYSPLDLQTFQSKFGMSQIFGGGETYSIEVSFAQCVERLGRPIVIGDIIQLPSETQYSPSLKPIYKYLEVTDVAWSTNGYTPNWKPTLQKILAEPIIASQETQDILGKLTEDIDTTGLVDINDGSFDRKYQDLANINQTILAKANDEVPERGEDFGEVAKLSEDVYEWQKKYPKLDMRKVDRNRSVYGIDAMPPNGLPYTQGDNFPTTPTDGAYHRLTYTFINNNIPARLHRWSTKTNRWDYLETDRRFAIKNTKPILQEFLNPDTSSVTKPQDMNDKF